MPSDIFICYAHKDNENPDPTQRWLDRLVEHLEPLNLTKQAQIWSDQSLEIGSNWHKEIQATLQEVKAAVLLVSPSFLASKYIRNSELPVLLKNAQNQGVVILPIILRQCLWRETSFKYPNPYQGPEQISLASLQAATSKPLNSLLEHEQDQVLYSVAKKILLIINDNQAPPPWVQSSEWERTKLNPRNKVKLISKKGVNYTRLRDLLAAGKWQEADQETGKVMCQVAGRTSEGWLDVESINNFSCEDLLTINKLWQHYSRGKFGFSVQKEIYESLGGTRQYNEEVWIKFAAHVGWRRGEEWLDYKNLNFNINALEGHLPLLSYEGLYYIKYKYGNFWEKSEALINKYFTMLGEELQGKDRFFVVFYSVTQRLNICKICP